MKCYVRQKGAERLFRPPLERFALPDSDNRCDDIGSEIGPKPHGIR
jgi:hypothetical protein